MSQGAVNHDYHLVNPSPWPALGSLAAFIGAVGFVVWMRGIAAPVETEGLTGLELMLANLSNSTLTRHSLPIAAIGSALLTLTFFGWWSDVIKESREGDHTPVVQIGLRYGMILFIASEVMFFVAWFWVFFEMAIDHGLRGDWLVPTWDAAVNADWAQWPPPNVEQYDPFHFPLLNTLILLLSGTTVTWAHHALQQGNRNSATWGLLLTVLLGMLFTYVQFVIEYPIRGFAFGNMGEEESANLYGAAFFMATGFHGFHVIIGTIFLAVCLFRLMAGHFTPQKHFGFEAAAWYWHFVDVVWLFLFTFVYVTPYIALGHG